MKKLLLVAAGVAIASALSAQTPVNTCVKVPAKVANKAATATPYGFVKSEYALPLRQGNSTTGATQVTALNEVVIGQTVYDLQTNSSVQNRVINYGNGVISAVYTRGLSDPNFIDRATGYSHCDGTNWTTLGAVENIRTGFPSIDRLQSGPECITAHDVNGSIQLSKNSTIGDLGFTNAATPMDSSFWPHMKVGGANGNTIHVVSLTNPTSGTPAGLPYMGIDGALVYSRSTNGGTTWDKQKVLLPGIDSTLFKRFSGDAYSIDSRGDVVAFVAGGFTTDMFLMKSTDNGDTWTKTRIMDFPIDAYDDDITDVNGDNIADTIETNDGAMAIIIDNNNKVHIFTGAMRVMNDDSTDGTYSYFPGTAALLYWNEDMGADSIQVVVNGVPDRNNNGDLDIGTDIPVYQLGLISTPSVGIDASNRLYVTFSCIADGTLLDTRSYRHTFGFTTPDGINLTPVVDLTGFDDFTEYMYGSIARNVDNNVHLVYQSDGEPGIAVSPEDNNPHSFGNNEIVYLAVGSLSLINSATETPTNVEGVNLYPNPATGSTQLNFTLTKPSTVNATVINMVGQTVQSVSGGNFGTGTHTVTLDVNALPAGLYFVSLTTNNTTVTRKLIVR